MAELITQRIRRNANELRLHGISENPTNWSTAPSTRSL